VREKNQPAGDVRYACITDVTGAVPLMVVGLCLVDEGIVSAGIGRRLGG